MGYFGDIRLGDTIDVKFTTVGTDGTPTTLSSSPVISAYPGNSTTELTAGITLSVDFDSRTGLNNIRVVASSGNGYLTATNYGLIVTTGTVGGTSVVGYEVGSFSIENRSAVMPTTAARTLDVSATGEAGLDWANVGSPTTSLGLTGTTISTTQAITSVSGAVGSVTGAVGSVTGAVGSVTGAVGSVTGAVGSVTGAVGSVTGNVGGNVTGSVGSVATGGIAAASFAAGAIDAAAIAASAIGSSELAAGAITAAKFATDAIDANALAADAVTEIGAGVLTAATAAPIASNMKKINGTTVNGNGGVTPWGP